MLRLLLFIAFLVVPIAEIWLLIQVGQTIGGWQTVGLLVLAGMFGTWLIRREGRRTWLAVQEALAAGRIPDRELVDGALVVAGGTLLLTPGFLSDLLGVFFVLPVTRPIARRAVAWFFARRVRLLTTGTPYGPLFGTGPGAAHTRPGGDAPHDGARPRHRVVPGEVIRDDTGDTGTPPPYPAAPAQDGRP
jgi:UPF0716 protein FxsA